jgi:hypothetical protein
MLVAAEVRRDSLESDLTLQAQVCGAVDFAHASFAEELMNRESAEG